MDRREFLITLATMTGIDVLSPLNVAVDQLFASNTPTQTEIYYPYSAVNFGTEPINIGDTPIDGLNITTTEVDDDDDKIQPVVEDSPPISTDKSMNERTTMSIVIDSYVPWSESTIAIIPRTIHGKQYEPQIIDTVTSDDTPCVKTIEASELHTRPDEPHTYIGVLVPSNISKIKPNNSLYLGETTPVYYNGTHQVRANHDDPLEFNRDVVSYDKVDYGGSYFMTNAISVPNKEIVHLTYTVGKSHFFAARQARRSIFGCWKEAIDSPYSRYIANRISTFVDEKNDEKDDEEWGMAEKYEIARLLVQGMVYELDSEGTQYEGYTRYPVETLVDTTVDCKDSTVLLGGILQQEPFNCDVVMLIYDGHVNIGVVEDDVYGKIDDDPVKYVVNGKTYIAVECTRTNVSGSVGQDWDYVGAHDETQMIDIEPEGFIEATEDEEIFG